MKLKELENIFINGLDIRKELRSKLKTIFKDKQYAKIRIYLTYMSNATKNGKCLRIRIDTKINDNKFILFGYIYHSLKNRKQYILKQYMSINPYYDINNYFYDENKLLIYNMDEIVNYFKQQWLIRLNKNKYLNVQGKNKK